MTTMAEVTYSISIEPEDIPVRGNACASGDTSHDRAVEREIYTRLDRGDTWAWCTVKVTASVTVDGETFEGTDYLGSCSYADQSEFESDAYFDDMKREALHNLKSVLAHASHRGQVAAEVVAATLAK